MSFTEAAWLLKLASVALINILQEKFKRESLIRVPRITRFKYHWVRVNVNGTTAIMNIQVPKNQQRVHMNRRSEQLIKKQLYCDFAPGFQHKPSTGFIATTLN
jgi:hypothetical protein